MFAQLSGKLAAVSKDHIVIDVNGVGYEVFVATSTLEKLPSPDQSIKVLIHTHVTETSLALYGFLTLQEKSLFKVLISVSGIGPKLAMQILSGLTAHELIQSVIDENVTRLTRISGVGKKTAERLVVELKDKVLKLVGLESVSMSKDSKVFPIKKNTVFDEAFSALVNLGYGEDVADRALSKINLAQLGNVEMAIKEALRELAH